MNPNISILPTIKREISMNMNIELYPTFESVFIDEQLKGIFYPLCAIELNDENHTKLFFVSSNGIWTNKEHQSNENTNIYTKFNLVNHKYKFNGNIELYNGYKIAKEIFKILEIDFEEKGNQYLKNKTKTEEYINQVKPKISLTESSDFDLDYYLQTFYEYSINKLNYQINKEFGAFRNIIDNWRKPEKSPIVYEIDASFGDIEVNAEYLFPKNIKLSDYEKIGQVIGYEFFTDGNNSVLLYNKKDKTILSVNSYS